jgi:hypothetical protein
MSVIRIAFVLFLLASSGLTGYTQSKPSSSFPELKKFQFKSLQSKTLPGLIAEKELNGTINEDEKIGNLVLALYSDKGLNGYIFRDGRYNNSNYLVEQGEVRDQSGKNILPAFRISPPKKMKKEFVASFNSVYIKFPTVEDYTIYEVINDNIFKRFQIVAASIQQGGYTKIDLAVSELSKPITFFYEVSKNNFSVHTTIAPGVEAAQIQSNAFFKVKKYRYKVEQVPYDFISNLASPTRKFFLNRLANDKVALVWQNSDRSQVFNSVLGADLKTISTTSLKMGEYEDLLAAVTTLDGTVYYLGLNDLAGSPTGNLYRSKLSDKSFLAQPMNMARNEMNIYSQSGGYVDLEFSRDTLLLMIARKMHASGDGLNHQGGIAVKFDAKSLQKITNFGQTSGHSFDNIIALNDKGDFVGMDLGDNYPRGVNLHTFNRGLNSQVVYTFKTKHGVTADCYGIATYPEYPEISTKEKKYYKWSNDNGTYSELGGIVDAGDGYVVSFCGEPDQKGLSLDNRKAGEPMPRNVGFVKVVKNFYDIYEGQVNEVSEKMILSKGISEKGGFFTFGGKWAPQQNNGVVWLTQYNSPDQAARHLKTVKLPNKNILFVWELWKSYDYEKTFALIVDPSGKKVSDFIELGSNVRLHRRDEPLVIGKKIIFAGGSQADSMLELVVMEFNP